MQEKKTDRKQNLYKFRTVAVDFNMLLNNRQNTQKKGKDKEDMNNIIKQLDLSDISRIL